MRILVLPGTFDGANLGDVAMLEVALRRLRELWPGASFHLITRSPEFCTSLGADVHPISAEAWKHWAAASSGSWKRLLPARAAAARRFAVIFEQAELVVLTGSGALTDAFEPTALRLLSTLDSACERGIPTAVLGQGIGPIRSRLLLDAVRTVFPRLGAVFVREPSSAALLLELGVSAEHIRCTGDDAIELVTAVENSAWQRGLGVNLRVSDYGGLRRSFAAAAAEVLMEKAGTLGASIIPVPIANGDSDSDLGALAELFPAAIESGMPWTAQAVIERAARCRVVVAASYHAAVFALALGTPVVTIAQSTYYAAKFSGLARQFGPGCNVLFGTESEMLDSLAGAIDEAWLAAPELKSALREAARQQVLTGREAYTALASLVVQKKGVLR